MMIFALGFLGISKMQAAVVSASASAKARAEAITLAQARVDALRLIARQSEHFSTAGGGCTTGTLVQASPAAVVTNGINAVFSQTWAVTQACTPSPRHQVRVQVAWTDELGAAQTVQLDSVIAWNDPVKNFPIPQAGAPSGGGIGIPSNVRLGDDVKDYDTAQGTANGSDGSYLNFNSSTNEYELLVPVTGGFRVALYSNVPLVKVTGLVVLDNTSGYSVNINNLKLRNITVYRTDITYCIFPLSFSDENNPDKYGSSNGSDGGVFSSDADRAGAYVCYVPEGWSGNIGLLNYELISGNNATNYACPDDENGNTIFEAARSHRVQITNSGGTVVGQSGVLKGHEGMIMPNYPNLTRLSRLDFLVFKIPNGQFSGCQTRIGNTVGVKESGTNASNNATYSVLLRTDAPLNRSTSPVTPGVPSIRHSNYIVDRYTSDSNGSVIGGFVKITGQLSGTCINTTIRASGTSTYRCTSPTSTSYSCSVGYGWSGDLGYWNSSTSTFTNASPRAEYSNLTADTTGPALTCSN